MPNLYEVLADAQNGEAMTELGREFGLSPQQTQAAVAALLPAISMGLKRTTATPEGLGELLALMGAQPELYAMYDDPQDAFSPEGRAAGNAALSRMFGSPDASRAIADQAQQLSGISSAILKKLLPVLAGLIISSLMRSGSGKAAPSAPQPSPDQGGGLGDILRQIFRQGAPESDGPATSPAPQTAPKQDGSLRDKLGPGPGYQIPTGGQQSPVPTDPAVKPPRAATSSRRSCASWRRRSRRGASSRSLSAPLRSVFLDKPDLLAKRRIRWETSSVKSCVTYSVARVAS